MKTCRNCGNEFPSTINIDGISRNISKRQYCLECSPFGKRNRKILERGVSAENTKLCFMCEQIKPADEFYPKRKTKTLSAYCKICSGIESKARQAKFKKDCLSYKGEQCVNCGYDRCDAALDFHHLDKSKKEFSISNLRFYKMNDKVKSELDKCVVLCSNCHREVHAGLIDLSC